MDGWLPVINNTTNLSERLPVINDTTNLSKGLSVITNTSKKTTYMVDDLYGQWLVWSITYMFVNKIKH